ncbi:UNVERIFIED_CONTAM: Subtilisin-like protease SBT1.8 [Sesamum latifolium]|uniref:Subtilisin-like protease SBT1.8 n=1 Tax=Sesamum latifolium TaxID=2727402 RepID=A0AAW2VCG5_9LAMI
MSASDLRQENLHRAHEPSPEARILCYPQRLVLRPLTVTHFRRRGLPSLHLRRRLPWLRRRPHPREKSSPFANRTSWLECMRTQSTVSIPPAHPEFLGLDSGLGPWAGHSLQELNQASQDVIIGVLDTGVWPESKSFIDADMPDVPARWRGECEAAHDFDPKIHCNKKLIGARFFSSIG